ncbi:hypothetical protein BOX15_Mlig016435g1, partial [Macrostomum lignano]
SCCPIRLLISKFNMTALVRSTPSDNSNKENLPGNAIDTLDNSQLIRLPVELIERLCGHLDCRSVAQLSATCQRMRQLLGSRVFWQMRVRRLLHSRQLPGAGEICDGAVQEEAGAPRRFRLPDELSSTSSINSAEDAADGGSGGGGDVDDLDDGHRWRRRCTALETAIDRFGDPSRSRHRRMQYGIGVCIDALQLLPSSCGLAAVGSRDQTFGLVSLRGIRSGAADADCFSYRDRQHHRGWIWSVAAHEDSVLTGCWDRVLRRFALHPAQLADAVMLGSPVLCTAWLGKNVALAGCFDRSAYVLDCRDIRDTRRRVTVHSSRPVLCVLPLSDHYLLTAGEDTNVCVTDLRASLSQPVQQFSLGRSRYLRCLSSQQPAGDAGDTRQIWGAVQHGGIRCFNWCRRHCRLIDASSFAADLDAAEFVGSDSVQQEQQQQQHQKLGVGNNVTCIDSPDGAVLVCRERHPMQAYLATLPPRPLAGWPNAVSVSCRDGVVATGSLDGDLQFWWRD